MGQLKINVTNIQSTNPFTVSYKMGSSPYPLDSGYTSYNGVYSGGTSEVDITGNFNFGEEYWIKISDTIYTDRYIIQNILLNNSIAYQACLYPTLTPSPTPTPTPTPSAF